VTSNRIVFIKHSDCISEYKHIYENDYAEIADGPEPYLKQIISVFEKKNFCMSILSLGDRNSEFHPRKNIELRVIKNKSQGAISRALQFVNNNFILFVYLVKRDPGKIINLGDLSYLPLLLTYSYLSGSDIYLFLAGLVERNIILNRLSVKMMNKRISKVVSRNRVNIDVLHSLGYSGEWDLYKPHYEQVCSTQLRATELRKDNNFKVLFIARLAFVKGIDVLQTVAFKAKEQGISFYVIGDGPYYERLRVFKQHNEVKNLHPIGFMQHRDVSTYIKDSDIGFVPSKSEGVCKTALEFMLMETPVVASHVGGIPEIVTDGVNGFLVDPGAVDGFLKRIVQLQNDKALLSQLSQGASKAKMEILNYGKNFSCHLEEIFK